jgi:AraC-like DNA-binding protein
MPVELLRHEWEHGWWSMATATPHVALRGIVRGRYCGWTEHSRRPVRRRELASTVVPLIINFGSSYRLVSGHETGGRGIERGSFVAGLYDTWVDVDSASTACALQVNFTPLGARLVLQRPMVDVASASVDVADVLGAPGAHLIEQLGNLPSWPRRFALIERFLRERVQYAVRAPAAVEWAWQELHTRRGDVRIGDLCAQTGWSAKRLIAAFREHVGLPPKVVARVLRFEHLVARLDDPGSASWSARALESGFFDQSHLIRDFAAFAGCSPGAYLRERDVSAATAMTGPA